MDALPADDRVLCNACRYLVASARCRNWRAADLTGPPAKGTPASFLDEGHSQPDSPANS